MDQLQADSRIDSHRVRVVVRRGEVTLSGTVPSYSAREAARSDTWLVPGVRRVHDRLEVRSGAPVSADDLIERNVRNLLRWSRDVDGSRIQVSCRDGRVTLQGAVDAEWQRRRTTELASYVVGVQEVIDHLRVEEP